MTPLAKHTCKRRQTDLSVARHDYNLCLFQRRSLYSPVSISRYPRVSTTHDCRFGGKVELKPFETAFPIDGLGGHDGWDEGEGEQQD
jgi:hypothetical protein